METWQESKVTVKCEGEEPVSNLLIELGAQGVAPKTVWIMWEMSTALVISWCRGSKKKVVDGLLPNEYSERAVEADLQARLAELTGILWI